MPAYTSVKGLLSMDTNRRVIALTLISSLHRGELLDQLTRALTKRREEIDKISTWFTKLDNWMKDHNIELEEKVIDDSTKKYLVVRPLKPGSGKSTYLSMYKDRIIKDYSENTLRLRKLKRSIKELEGLEKQLRTVEEYI